MAIFTTRPPSRPRLPPVGGSRGAVDVSPLTGSFTRRAYQAQSVPPSRPRIHPMRRMLSALARAPIGSPPMRRLAPLLAALLWLQAAPPAPASRFPNVVLVTVDTLRAARVSSDGYSRPPTPNIAPLLARGARFAQARPVEPLTTPALASLLTSRYPHEHGSTRNSMPLRAALRARA